jgi:hypothetical protein
MKFIILILAALIQNAGNAFLEPIQKRDSILIADQLRYGIVLENVADGTPLALPEFKMEGEGESPLVIVNGWQLDSTRVSKKKETPARYNIKAYLTLASFMGGTIELPDIPVLLDADTLVFKAVEPLEIKELPVDMETFQPNDIKPQEKFPYTFKEVFPWVAGALALIALIYYLVVLLLKRKKAAIEKEQAEPAHIKALRKLDKFRGDKYWKPEHQKAFYSGVTDALREYIDGLKGTDVPKDLYDEMKELFERADFVKFAKYIASDEDNARVLPGAVRFVTQTYMQEIPDQVGDDGKGNDNTVMPGTDRASQNKQ